jgi:hypothetical protein
MAPYRFWGDPPPKPASRLERFQWLRGFYLRSALLVVPILIIGAVWSTSLLIVALIVLAAQAIGFLVLLVQIRAERRNEA